MGPPKSAEIAENSPGSREHGRTPPPHGGEPAGRDAHQRAERHDGRLGPEHGAEREGAERGERDPRSVGDRCRRRGKALERRMAAVARQQRTSREDEQRADDRQPDHEVPRRRGVAERVREVVPEPVLEVVDERQEERGDDRGRYPDRRSEEDEVEVRAAADRRRTCGAGFAGLALRGRRRAHCATESAPATM
jgi:hypothetical protein